MSAAFLVIDKPAGITSHDVVAAVRAVLGIEKVGHTGTLDPFATGVLPLALGGATRLIQFLDESVKVYDATLKFGEATDTGDPTGQVIRTAAPPTHSEAEIDQVLKGFLGPAMQKPPAYSAVKRDGKPLYEYARAGQTVEVEARPITFHDLERVSYDGATLRVKITCSRGTYARVFAEDVARALGTEAHLSALSRLRSGPFYLDDALSLEKLAAMASPDSGKGWFDVLIARGRNQERVPWRPREDLRAEVGPWLRRPLDVLSHLPLLDVNDEHARRIRNGASLPPPPAGVPFGHRYLVVQGADLLAVAESNPKGPKSVRLT